MQFLITDIFYLYKHKRNMIFLYLTWLPQPVYVILFIIWRSELTCSLIPILQLWNSIKIWVSSPIQRALRVCFGTQDTDFDLKKLSLLSSFSNFGNFNTGGGLVRSIYLFVNLSIMHLYFVHLVNASITYNAMLCVWHWLV